MSIWKLLEQGTKMAMQASCGTVAGSDTGLHGYEGTVTSAPEVAEQPKLIELVIREEGPSLGTRVAAAVAVTGAVAAAFSIANSIGRGPSRQERELIQENATLRARLNS